MGLALPGIEGKQAMEDARLLKTKEVAALFQVAAVTVDRLRKDGKLGFVRISGKTHGAVRFRKSDLEDYLAGKVRTGG